MPDPDWDSFIDTVHQALRQYDDDELGESTLAHSLHLVQHRLDASAAPGTPLQRAAALRTIFVDSLEAMAERGQAEAAQLLEARFIAGCTAFNVAQKLNVSEATLFTRQAKALQALAATIREMERAGAQMEHRTHLGLSKLPAPTYTRLFGANERLAALADALSDTDSRWLITVDGLGGTGKTALAREAVARALADNRFLDLVWETAQRERFAWGGRQKVAAPALTFEMLLDAIASQLGHADIRRQPLAQKEASIRYLLKDAPYLIVVDNLETAQDVQAMVEALWSLSNPSKILLTSRHRLTRFDLNHSIHVSTLPQEETLAFLRYHAQERGVVKIARATSAELRSIHIVTGGNPLAIKLVVGQVDRRPLDTVLTELQLARGSTTDLYTFIYHYSWTLLSDPARRLLLNMASLPPTGGHWDDILALSGLTQSDLIAAVDELVDMSLLDVSNQPERRYSIHSLTRQFILSALT